MANPKRFKFSRSRCTSVEAAGDNLLRTVCRLNDMFCEMRVTVEVQLPDMEIKKVECAIERCYDPAEHRAIPLLPQLAGIRVGPGMAKIFKGLVGEEAADSQLLFMVEEACHGVILSSTKDMAAMAPNEDDLPAEIFQSMAKANTRLIGRCAAYAPESSMVRGALEEG